MFVKSISAAAIVAAAFNAGAAIAQTTPSDPERNQVQAERPLPILIPEDELRTTRGTGDGGTSIVINQQTLNAIVSGNVLGDYSAGDVNFADNALSNFSGIGNFTINTGAQNNLQTAMILTVNITD
ncbi:hypothetical protein [Stakelama marina]|uniref:Holdfast attachment protein HfaA n=1 Tax=Stakelama marina TaxID=2826939 RepID=A0A8T4ICM2_9SPHN|nr:hypothetical protein [Stakelama marina]MBR0551852.1 hypothetical protein [Stakelama marina]